MMKSIKSKILVCTITLVIAALAVTGGIASWMNFTSTVDALQSTLSEAVIIAGNQVSAELKAYHNVVQEFTYNSVLFSSSTYAEKINQLHQMQENQGFDIVCLTSAYGTDLESGRDLSQRIDIQTVMSTQKPFISDPVINDDLGDMVIYFAAPVLTNGRLTGVISAGKRAGFLSELVSSIHVGSGNAAILNNQGNTIGFSDYDLVLQQYNTQKEAVNDPQLARLAQIEANMSQGLTGFGDYSYGGVEKMMAYCPIPGTNGWSIDIAIVQSEFMHGTNTALLITLIVGIIALILAVLIAVFLSNAIANPLKTAAERLEKLAEGDLESSVHVTNSGDETSLLTQSMAKTVEQMREIIIDITHHLGAMAKGDFTAVITQEYKGGFLPIKQAIENISSSLNSTLLQINITAEQVSSGSEQVSAGAQALSQGATEQASSVEELAATINEVSDRVKNNAENSIDASEKAQEVGKEMLQCNDQMHQMINAMNHISNSSGEIGKIIKTIEDIAFQTNILALNAAVEAARAGAAGKGFAVVADEVRNLASKSAQASKETSALIEESVKAVEDGSQIANATAESLLTVVENTKGVVTTIDKISAASKEQASSIEQITMGIDQISSVVQTNSATAQQSAAASEELSAQADAMKRLVSTFQLRAGDSEIKAEY